ncbi:MFS transporter [Flagellimonas zhangzhouensis]|uniref:Maltose/moltooligosaccharide transporter n=1 Tax=Flagellimonas zhangzhouensis TaxID=1073328 RepID=A0A1H2QRE9_9FLAO|nr:MFS transporter [Allomuricauda zhangzhouensis]SDQ55772.1 maltose/moltooligosaccharide transporter [Allomuricauda zhangzhouensis]SDW09450.1 maltose/moltooligosaccharide transporter [Allomuricauda zhangzhouensis]
MFQKRRLSFWEIWNLSFGFLGIQMGFALQNANASRILQSFGADVHELSWFWIVAPLTGLIIQPIVGHYSDKTWTRLGRRRPFFLTGALLASLGLVLMPNADMFTAIMPSLWVGAGMLMVMDASFNIAMEPFRALIADMLPSDQRTLGYSVQTVLIGIGAVIGSWLPYALTNWVGINNVAAAGEVPLNLLLSFIIGALVLVISVAVTVFTTKEYSPEEMAQLNAAEDTIEEEESTGGLMDIFTDFAKMPLTMRQLSWVQFFSWFGLFGLWVFTTPAVAEHIYGLDPNNSQSAAYQDAGDWVGILFGVYNGVSAVFAFFLPAIAKKVGRKKTHTISLVIGALGFLSIYIMPDENWLILSMIGIGIAWASILAMPYAILAGAIPARKMGVYMGIFNFFIVIPQIVNAFIGGPMVQYLYGGKPIYALMTSGVAFIIAALLVSRVQDIDDEPATI